MLCLLSSRSVVDSSIRMSSRSLSQLGCFETQRLRRRITLHDRNSDGKLSRMFAAYTARRWALSNAENPCPDSTPRSYLAGFGNRTRGVTSAPRRCKNVAIRNWRRTIAEHAAQRHEREQRLLWGSRGRLCQCRLADSKSGLRRR